MTQPFKTLQQDPRSMWSKRVHWHLFILHMQKTPTSPNPQNSWNTFSHLLRPVLSSVKSTLISAGFHLNWNKLNKIIRIWPRNINMLLSDLVSVISLNQQANWDNLGSLFPPCLFKTSRWSFAGRSQWVWSLNSHEEQHCRSKCYFHFTSNGLRFHKSVHL